MNLFLISSPSYNELNEEIKKIINGDLKPITFDLEENTLEEVVEEANYASFLGDQKYLVVNNAYIFTSESTKEENLEILLNYLEHSNPSTTLIFTTLKPLDERKKLVKLMKEKGQVIIKKNVTDKDLVNLIQNLMKEKKKQISLKAINQIIELCQSNYDLILQEINKLLIYYDDKNIINDDEIPLIVSNETLISNFKFSDAVIAKDMNKAFKLFDKLKENKEEPVMLIGLLASQYRLILTVKYYLNNNFNKEAIVSKLKIHPYRVEIAINNAYNFSTEELFNKLSLLANLDYQIKSGQADGYAGLEMFLLEI